MACESWLRLATSNGVRPSWAALYASSSALARSAASSRSVRSSAAFLRSWTRSSACTARSASFICASTVRADACSAMHVCATVGTEVCDGHNAPYPSESDPVGGRSGLAGRGVGLRTRQRDAGVTRPHPQLVGVGAERAQEPPPVPLVAPDLLVIAQHAVAGQNAAQLDEQVRPAPPRPRSANRRDGFPWWPP